MPVVFTFDLEGALPKERNRIQSFFERLGWQNIGGSSYRYPKLGSEQPVEDWFNHVVPALTLFRSFVRNSGRRLRNYTIDVQSSSGFDEAGKYGCPPEVGKKAKLYVPTNTAFGETKLRDWLSQIDDTYPY
jgi:hypothetical protein